MRLWPTILHEAARKVPQERRRIAVGATLRWFRQRQKRYPAGTSQVAFDSVESLFAALEAADPPGENDRRFVTRFEFLRPEEPGMSQVRTVTFSGNCVRVDSGDREHADLVVVTDAEALLATVNGQPSAIDAIQAGRFELRGDARQLAHLANLIESQATRSPAEA